MKALLVLIGGLLCLITSACGSDELVTPYTGPWEIQYIESWEGIHNNSLEFEEWFQRHTDYFVEAYLSNKSGTSNYHYTDYIDPSDYKYYYGQIYWVEVIPNATEDEVGLKVAEFESFTIIDDKDKKADIFQAKYVRCDGK